VSYLTNVQPQPGLTFSSFKSASPMFFAVKTAFSLNTSDHLLAATTLAFWKKRKNLVWCFLIGYTSVFAVMPVKTGIH
jgi:hypothetical protein